MYSSKTDRILSRYRRIAPKPVPFPSSSSFAADPPSFCASVDSFSPSGKFKRVRKRKAADAFKQQQLQPLLKSQAYSGLTNTAVSSSVTQGVVSDGTVPDMLSFSGKLGFQEAPAGPQEASEVSWASPAPVCVALTVPAGRPLVTAAGPQVGMGVLGSGYGGSSVLPVEKDMAFLERAAESTERAGPAPVKPPGDGAGVVCVGGGFTEMIRGITRLPTAADVQSLMQTRASAADMQSLMQSRAPPSGPPPAPPKNHHIPLPTRICPIAQNPGSLFRSDGRSAFTTVLPSSSLKLTSSLPSPAVQPNCSSSSSSNPHSLVTLSLLPETPVSQAVSSPSTTASSSCTTISASPPELGLCCNTEKVASYEQPIVPCSVAPIREEGLPMDQAYLEQVYGASPDPVMLMDERSRVLWFNKAYEKASKAASGRPSRGPFIDPLGHPTPLCSFTFHPLVPATQSSSSAIVATLWGFLRKLVVQQEPEILPKEDHTILKLGVLTNGGAASRPLGNRHGSQETSSSLVAAHDPSRLLTVTLESITDLHPETSPLVESLEAAEARLSDVIMPPAFITDCTSRVRSVNGAFRRMLGHTENVTLIPYSSSPPAVHTMRTIAAVDLTFVCSAENMPRSAWAFSGRVNLEWLKGGKRRSMNVPCDVCRLITASKSMEMWVWTLDTAASLCL